MEVEISLLAVPADQGTVVLAKANEEFCKMINVLSSSSAYGYVLPSPTKREYLISHSGSMDFSILAQVDVLQHDGLRFIYRQPYSEGELADWLDEAEVSIRHMIHNYREIQEEMNTDE